MRSRTPFAFALLAALLALVLPLAGCSLLKAEPVYATEGHLDTVKTVDGAKLDPQLSAGTLAFSLALYDRLREDAEGAFVSPASVFLALAMARNGAAGETAAQMDAMFGFTGASLDAIDGFARDLQYLIRGRTPSAFELANSLWIRDTFQDKVKKDFLDRNASYFGAAIQALDFSAPAARDTINAWVAKNTKDRIQTILDDAIDPSSVMFLVNTIYFKADWRTAFDRTETVDAAFHAKSGDVEVAMMKRIDAFGYFENADLQAVRLPYADGRTSMVVLLPKVSRESVAAALTPDLWNAVLAGVSEGNTRMVLRMPRTKYEFKAELKGPLADLGMPVAFTDSADFSGISDQGLLIGSVLHKTFLLIDEKGTEAAAATSVDIRVTSMPTEPDLKVTLDRPFVVAIVDDASGLPLFLGNIDEPQP